MIWRLHDDVQAISTWDFALFCFWNAFTRDSFASKLMFSFSISLWRVTAESTFAFLCRSELGFICMNETVEVHLVLYCVMAIEIIWGFLSIMNSFHRSLILSMRSSKRFFLTKTSWIGSIEFISLAWITKTDSLVSKEKVRYIHYTYHGRATWNSLLHGNSSLTHPDHIKIYNIIECIFYSRFVRESQHTFIFKWTEPSTWMNLNHMICWMQ